MVIWTETRLVKYIEGAPHFTYDDLTVKLDILVISAMSRSLFKPTDKNKHLMDPSKWVTRAHKIVKGSN